MTDTRSPLQNAPADRGNGVLTTAARSGDRDQAEQLVTDWYLPHRLELAAGSQPLQMEISCFRLCGLTVGRLSYGRPVHLTTVEAREYHVNIPLAGKVRSWNGGQDSVIASADSAAVFTPGLPAKMSWAPASRQLCLMIEQSTVEEELEKLLGRSVSSPVRFDFAMNLMTTMGRQWRHLLGMLARELEDGPALGTHPLSGPHVRSLVLDGLLLGQRHSYTEEIEAGPSTAPYSAVARAVQLLRDRPTEPWSTVGLAAAVHISVRALQEGFKREVDMPPMQYLRDLRLQRVRQVLLQADPARTTVAAVASGCGFGHLGRFAADYRRAFGELPSVTLSS